MCVCVDVYFRHPLRLPHTHLFCCRRFSPRAQASTAAAAVAATARGAPAASSLAGLATAAPSVDDARALCTQAGSTSDAAAVAAAPADDASACAVSSAIVPNTFLVAHPVSRPGDDTVVFIVRCSAERGVLGYTLPPSLPDVVLGDKPGASLGPSPSPPAPVATMSPPYLSTLVSGHSSDGGLAAGRYEQLSLDTLQSEVDAGQWIVMKHRDPWGVMTSSTSPWQALLSGLGGHAGPSASLPYGTAGDDVPPFVL